LSRPELIKQLKQKNPELNQSDLETVIDTFCESIEKALKNNSYIELRDFGTFFVKKVKEKHSARNPKTGELIYVPEKNKVRFRASKKLKEFINNE
jgi:nucleoid DNA-binding protein|tara:strand:- start:310 stop:594 length:285 start_codon:yes stop_codon:yes gene_type:complete